MFSETGNIIWWAKIAVTRRLQLVVCKYFSKANSPFSDVVCIFFLSALIPATIHCPLEDGLNYSLFSLYSYFTFDFETQKYKINLRVIILSTAGIWSSNNLCNSSFLAILRSSLGDASSSDVVCNISKPRVAVWCCCISWKTTSKEKDFINPISTNDHYNWWAPSPKVLHRLQWNNKQ